MTASYLPDDCIYNILKYFQNYRPILFNCLLVNRFWCRATVPLLYANPFYLVTTRTDNNLCSIILTLILCFNKTTISQVKNQLEFNNITNNININDKYKPLFNYPKYLESYYCHNVNALISEWIKSSYNQNNASIFQIFHQSIFHQCNNIKQLEISLCSKVYKNFNFQSCNLSKLNSLSLNGIDDEIAPEFLNCIANISLNLKKLEINSADTPINNITKNKLCKIIQKQNNLKEIKIEYCVYLNDIFLSLEFQKHSLVCIDFSNIYCFDNISFKNFVNLSNLKYLSFYECDGEILLDQYEILKYASFKLKGLDFRYNFWNEQPLMIKYLGESLEELILIDVLLEIQIIENILTYCSNLITLEIEIDSNIDLLVFPYFKNLNVRRLFLYIDKGAYNNIILNLANNLPISVKEVSIRFHYCYKSQDSFKIFKTFLENCHDCLEIISLLEVPIKLDFLKIIFNYIEKNKNVFLRLLGVNLKEKELDEDETKLLNQIRDKGVKIVKFNNNI